MVQKEKVGSSNGITWACEVGNETMFCPLIVEDLSIRGQMLIEVRGYVLISFFISEIMLKRINKKKDKK